MLLLKTRQIIVVPEDKQDFANRQCADIDTKGGEKTFTVGLSPNGTKPPTHYWCCWLMEDLDKQKLVEKLSDIPVDFFELYPTENYTPDDVLQEEGLQRIQTDDIEQ